MKKAYIDIENSKTKKVITIITNIVECDLDDKIIFDISDISTEELRLLVDAIDKEKNYTDIELFFVENYKYPIFGPDYLFEIIDDKLIATYNRKIMKGAGV